MKTLSILGAVACAALLSTSPAIAQNGYVELGAGRSHADADCSGTTTCDRDGTAVRGVLGFELTPNWALEVALADLGRLKATAEVPGIGTAATTARLRSAGVGVAGTLPLGDAFAVTARLGVASNRTSVSASAAGASIQESETNTAAYAGAAVRYALSRRTALALTVDRTEAEYGGDKTPVVALGLSLRLSF